MKVLYVASVFDDRCLKSRFGGRSVLPYAASKYNTLLFEGIVKNGIETEVISVVPINRGIYKKLFFKGYTEKKEKLKIRFLSQINLPVVKNAVNIATSFFKTLFAPKGSVVIYDVLVVSASMGALMAAKLRRFKRVGIVTDLPKFQPVAQSSFLLKGNNKVVAGADAYVFLTEKMNDEVNTAGKPYIVLEGHANEEMKNTSHAPFTAKEKNIVYAGAVEKIYGLEMLCHAFLDVAAPGEYLHIYGNGDYATELSELAKQNGNIIYHGNRPNSEVVEAELNATLLVNPRPTDGEYTKFSFPSKTLEYMVSGAPVLSSRLDGIPREYESYIFYFDENTKQSLGEKIRNVLDLPAEELERKGAMAKSFALENKNNVTQAAKIIEFCKKISEREV